MGTLASTRLLKNSACVSPSNLAVMLTSESEYGPAVSPDCKNRAILPPATIFSSSRCSMTGISPRPKGNSSSSLLVSSASRGARSDASICSRFRDGKCLKKTSPSCARKLPVRILRTAARRVPPSPYREMCKSWMPFRNRVHKPVEKTVDSRGGGKLKIARLVKDGGPVRIRSLSSLVKWP